MALGRFVVFLFGGLGVCLLAESRLRSQVREHKADASARYLGAIVESSDDAIIGKTLDGRITSWNAGAERLYGYSAADVLGQSVSILVPDDHPDELADILLRLTAGERIASYETERLRPPTKKQCTMC
jgi:PAS domain S-box-containing protein